jgi:hypothetical protein
MGLSLLVCLVAGNMRKKMEWNCGLQKSLDLFLFRIRESGSASKLGLKRFLLCVFDILLLRRISWIAEKNGKPHLLSLASEN